MRLELCVIMLVCLFLSGCAWLFSNAPTFEYCNEVHYDRIGNQITVIAKCSAPISSGSNLSIPKIP